MEMDITLANGKQATLLGPQRTLLADGSTFTSHTAFYVRLNNVIYTMSLDVFTGAKFPDDVEDQAEKAFVDSLPDVLDALKRLQALD